VIDGNACGEAKEDDAKLTLRIAAANCDPCDPLDPNGPADTTDFEEYQVEPRSALETSHARGLAGTPCSGHYLAAAANASWSASSAVSKSPSRQISAAWIRRDSR
jgi:hypothetical protein